MVKYLSIEKRIICEKNNSHLLVLPPYHLCFYDIPEHHVDSSHLLVNNITNSMKLETYYLKFFQCILYLFY